MRERVCVRERERERKKNERERERNEGRKNLGCQSYIQKGICLFNPLAALPRGVMGPFILAVHESGY